MDFSNKRTLQEVNLGFRFCLSDDSITITGEGCIQASSWSFSEHVERLLGDPCT